MVNGEKRIITMTQANAVFARNGQTRDYGLVTAARNTFELHNSVFS